MRQEQKCEYRGLAYMMEEISGEINGANSEDLTPEQAAHKAARWLIDCYI